MESMVVFTTTFSFQPAKDLLADAFEQYGYQQKSPSVRKSFFAATLEIRSGIPKGASPKTGGPDLICAITMDLYLDFLGIRMGVLTNIKWQQANDPDLTVTIDHVDLEQVMMGAVTFDQQIDAGKVRLDGNREVLEQLKSTLIQFELGFEIMPGTLKSPLRTPDYSTFQQEPLPYTGD